MPMQKKRHGRRDMVKISGKRTIDMVNLDWDKKYPKRQCLRDEPTAIEQTKSLPKKSCLKRELTPDDDGILDRPKKRVKIPNPNNPDVREFSAEGGDSDFDFDLNRIFKGSHGAPAFKKPEGAKVAKCRQNFGEESKATTVPGIGRVMSRLELLPAEVLQPILKHLLGDRTLHIQMGRGWKKMHPVGLPLDSIAGTDQFLQKAMRSYAVCREPNNENLPPTQRNSHRPYEKCHEACYKYGGPELYELDFDDKLHLDILQTSPLLYREGSAILWSSNMFAFNKPEVFTDFMQSVPSAKSIRKLELSHEVERPNPKAFNRITQQDEELLEWGLQDRNASMLDTLQGVDHLQLHFHNAFIADTLILDCGTAKAPAYDDDLHQKICSTFGDLRLLSKVRTVTTHASMLLSPHRCNCLPWELEPCPLGDEAAAHIHPHRLSHVEESFNSEVMSPLATHIIGAEESLRSQRREVFRLRTEAFERLSSLERENQHLDDLLRDEREAGNRLGDNEHHGKAVRHTAEGRARDAIAQKYHVAYSLVQQRRSKLAHVCSKEAQEIGALNAEADRLQEALQERWGEAAGRYLEAETPDPETESDADSDSEIDWNAV